MGQTLKSTNSSKMLQILVLLIRMVDKEETVVDKGEEDAGMVVIVDPLVKFVSNKDTRF